MVDVADSKSAGGDSVWVRVPPPAPRRSKLYIACSDLFYKSERAHAAAPPFQIEPAALGFDLGLFLSFAVSILCRRRHYVGVIFCIACSDLFYKSERAHAAAPPFQIEPAALGFDLGLFLSFAVSILCRRRHYVGVIFCIACSDLFYIHIRDRSCRCGSAAAFWARCRPPGGGLSTEAGCGIIGGKTGPDTGKGGDGRRAFAISGRAGKRRGQETVPGAVPPVSPGDGADGPGRAA